MNSKNKRDTYTLKQLRDLFPDLPMYLAPAGKQYTYKYCLTTAAQPRGVTPVKPLIYAGTDKNGDGLYFIRHTWVNVNTPFFLNHFLPLNRGGSIKKAFQPVLADAIALHSVGCWLIDGWTLVMGNDVEAAAILNARTEANRMPLNEITVRDWFDQLHEDDRKVVAEAMEKHYSLELTEDYLENLSGR